MILLLLLSLPQTNLCPKTLKKVADIPPPAGYSRQELPRDSFGAFLRNFPISTSETVHIFNGKPKARQDVHFAILDIDTGKRDLQQCADAVIRMRSEYLYSLDKISEIGFHFVSGDFYPYSNYLKGKLPSVKGNRVVWKKSNPRSDTKKGFRSYLDIVFTYAGTASLIHELKSIPIHKINAGDVWIQSRRPYGHAVLVMDIAVNSKGEKVFLLAQSYMPAQDMHILKNHEDTNLSPWYRLPESKLSTPEWDFEKEDLKRFP